MAYPYPKFIRDLALDMDIDYLIGLRTRFLEKDTCLGHKLVDFDIEQKKMITNHLNKFGGEDAKYFI